MKKNYENIIKLYNYAKRKLNEVLEHVKLCKYPPTNGLCPNRRSQQT